MSDIFTWQLGALPTLVALAFGYLLGSIPFGLILTRMAGVDIRTGHSVVRLEEGGAVTVTSGRGVETLRASRVIPSAGRWRRGWQAAGSWISAVSALSLPQASGLRSTAPSLRACYARGSRRA